MRLAMCRTADRTPKFPPTTGNYDVLMLNVYDGDTARVGLIVPITVRLFGINAPELRGPQRPDGLKSRDALREHLKTHRIVEINLHGTEKYGRTLGVFHVPETQPLSVNDWMVKQGMAKEYLP